MTDGVSILKAAMNLLDEVTCNILMCRKIFFFFFLNLSTFASICPVSFSVFFLGFFFLTIFLGVVN